MMNHVLLVGRLVKNPELTFLANGRARSRFTVAVERNYRSEKGARESDFVSCTMWGKKAESFATYMCKGAMCGLTGQIRTNRQSKGGTTHYFTDILCSDFHFIESKSIMQARREKTHDVITEKILRDIDAPVEIVEEELPF